MKGLIYGAFVLAMLPLISVSWTVLVNGIERFNAYFLTHSMRGVFGGMDAGGIYHAIIGTLEITLAATLISVPIGLLTAIYLVEYGRGSLARSVTFFVDVMTGIPSIVAGLFAYALFAVILGPGVRMGIVGAVALSVLMIPVVVRSCEEMLRLVPNELREAALALGVPRWLVVIKVVLRTSIAGIGTGITLAIARIIGETAPLLITVGVIDSINFNLFEGRMMTLPGLRLPAVLAGPRALHARRPRVHPDHQLRPGLGRGADADPHRHAAQPDRPPDHPLLRPQEPRLKDRPMAQRIDVKDLNIFYGDFRAVADVEMAVEPRSVTAFIGPSGCGKSTFLRTLNRMHEVIPGRPRAGQRRDGRRRPVRLRHRPGRRAPPGRHGVPAPQPVPDDVDRGERAGRHQAEQQAHLQGRTPRTSSRRRCAAPTSGTRSRTGSTGRAPGCRAASSSACASPAPSRSSRRCS